MGKKMTTTVNPQQEPSSVQESIQIVRNFRGEQECLDSMPTQSQDHIGLSADTGIRSQRLLGDWAVILPTDSRGVERLPAGYFWSATAPGNVSTGTIYRGCVHFSAHQLYPVMDGNLRISIISL